MIDWNFLAYSNQGLGITTPYTPSYNSTALIQWIADGTHKRGVPRLTIRRALEIAAMDSYDVVGTINFLDELVPMVDA